MFVTLFGQATNVSAPPPVCQQSSSVKICECKGHGTCTCPLSADCATASSYSGCTYCTLPSCESYAITQPICKCSTGCGSASANCACAIGTQCSSAHSGCACCSGTYWPTFQSSAELQADPWGAYYTKVYGAVPSSGYPIETSKLWMLYNKALFDAGLEAGVNIPAYTPGNCPKDGSVSLQLYKTNNFYQVKDSSWIWHEYPWTSFRDNMYAEVMRQADPFGDEGHGAWFVANWGSGMWFYMGKTIVFQEHVEAYSFFKVDPTSTNPNEAMSLAAAAAGYDSIQFMAHVDLSGPP